MHRSHSLRDSALLLVVLAHVAGCGARVSLPTTPRLEALEGGAVFAMAPPAAWPEAQATSTEQASLELFCGVAPSVDGIVYAGVSVRGRDIEGPLPPIHASLVLDRSGSMRGSAFRTMLEAAEAFVARLRVGDRVSVVVFSSGVYEAVAPIEITEASRAEIVAAIRSLRSGGSTWLSGGYLAGIAEVFEQFDSWHVNHVLLLSDGQPTTGITDRDALMEIAARAAEHGVGTTTVGFGLEHDELLMQGIADAGGGTYYYVGSASDIPPIFEQEASAILSTAARNTRTFIAIPEGYELLDVVGWDYVVLEGGAQVMLHVGSIPHGEERYALLKLRPVPSAQPAPLAIELTYADMSAKAYFALSCAPNIGPQGGAERWVLQLAGSAEASWGLAEAMSWADADRDAYAIAQLGYTRELLERMEVVLGRDALRAEKARLDEAQTVLGLRIADEAAGSLLSGGIAGLVNYGANQAARSAEAAAIDFAPRVRVGVPFSVYGSVGVRFSAHAGRAFRQRGGDKGRAYKQARYDAYRRMRVRVRVGR